MDSASSPPSKEGHQQSNVAFRPSTSFHQPQFDPIYDLYNRQNGLEARIAALEMIPAKMDAMEKRVEEKLGEF
uniref:Uncharacterized protein n=1 Tax=Panagrolaimus superbus TaxID=310955 RepID=A0A914Z974_9BILA